LAGSLPDPRPAGSRRRRKSPLQTTTEVSAPLQLEEPEPFFAADPLEGFADEVFGAVFLAPDLAPEPPPVLFDADFACDGADPGWATEGEADPDV
jgi:hypothetical protein